MAGRAVLSAAPQPREVDVRAPRARLRARLRLLRRRLGIDGNQRPPPERAQLRLERRHVDLEAPEEDREAPAGRAGLARSRDRLRAEAAAAGRRERARAVHRAPAQGPGRARRACLAVRNARDELLERLRGGAARRRVAVVSRSGLRARLDDAVRQGLQRPGRAEGPDRERGADARVDEAEHGIHELPDRAKERRGGIQQAERTDPERRDDPDPARPGSAGRRRHQGGRRRLQEVPEARADRSARPPGEEGAEEPHRNVAHDWQHLHQRVRLDSAGGSPLNSETGET